MQADAVGELPEQVRPLVRRPADGARRALLGLLPLQGFDLVHGLDVDLPLSVPLTARALRVCTVHDTSVYDVPWAHSRLRGRGEQVLVRQNVLSADAVLAVSAFTAERVHALFGVHAVVTPLAPGPGFAPAPDGEVARVRRVYRLPDTFVLHVGTVEPRKDVPMLAAVCRALDVPLVLVGAIGDGQAVPAGALHLGYVPASDLPALYSTATVVAYPSRYEGFGLPPLEALACGAAVVASRVGALPETLGEAAVLVPSRDPEALTTALRELLADPDRRSGLGQAGLERAASSRWSATADATRATYRSLGMTC
ncbi:MAG: glycosyltransferase [Frankiales bacterium]|nr:glycosyltransferase [Frankiales bacterium]